MKWTKLLCNQVCECEALIVCKASLWRFRGLLRARMKIRLV
nr:hypothetical protein [Paraburkholderia kirstenboschensis]